MHLILSVRTIYDTIFSVPSTCTGAMPWIDYDTKWKLYLDIGEEFSLKQKLKDKTINFWTKEMPPPNWDDFL